MHYTPKREPLDACPVETVFAIVGGKWKARILFELATHTYSFGALKKRLPGVSQQVLSTQLQALEQDGVITRAVTPASSHYALTAEGRSLIAVLDVVSAWGLVRLRRDGIAWPTEARP